VITYALLGLILALMKDPVQQIKQSGENLDFVTIIPYLLMGAISILLFTQVLRISAALGGGVALSTIGGFTRYITRPVSNVARWGSKQMGGRERSYAPRNVQQVSVRRPTTVMASGNSPTPSTIDKAKSNA
jgi:hypothetical protein